MERSDAIVDSIAVISEQDNWIIRQLHFGQNLRLQSNNTSENIHTIATVCSQ